MRPPKHIVRRIIEGIILSRGVIIVIWLLFIVRAWNHGVLRLSTTFRLTDEPGSTADHQLRSFSGPTSIVTFIVASKGRDTLNDTISSIYWQDDPRWEASVIHDGPEPQYDSLCPFQCDPRIKVYTIPKTGLQNFGATIRNYGMTKVRTDWVAFVDDDDQISTDYVTRLVEEIHLDRRLETIIFRMSGMYSNTLRIFPRSEDLMFEENFVGISFALRRTLFEAGFWFQPSHTEDFDLLERIFEARRRMVISPYVTYYVKHVRPTQESIESLPRHYLHRT
jgi:cellulose synthase/poly-beta-1,6-N-acetylglucosamine synthase-like glycosyltransferase